MKKAFLLLPILAASLAISQDMAKVAPQLVKVEYEDQHVRVVHLRVPPHESVPTHERPARVVIPLSTSDVSMPRADGTMAKVRSTAGEAGWGGPTKRSFVNLDAPVDNIIVDLKNAEEPAKPLRQPPPAVLANDNFHHWRFENQYVRVWDLRVPPGQTTGPYSYPPETVVVVVSGETSSLKPGHVEVITRDQKQRQQHLQNRGQSEYHAVIVQLLQ